jgi:hypothetical protein
VVSGTYSAAELGQSAYWLVPLTALLWRRIISTIHWFSRCVRRFIRGKMKYPVIIFLVLFGRGILFGQGLTINEFMPTTFPQLLTRMGEYDDWVEIYNNRDAVISLSGYYLLTMTI